MTDFLLHANLEEVAYWHSDDTQALLLEVIDHISSRNLRLEYTGAELTLTIRISHEDYDRDPGFALEEDALAVLSHQCVAVNVVFSGPWPAPLTDDN